MKNYSIVCYLEGKVYDKVRAIQERLFEFTGSRKCLDAWQPHITLGSGIVVSPEQQALVDESFRIFAERQKSFDLELNGFGGTDNWSGARPGIATAYVLWVDPVVTELLQDVFDVLADTITSKYETFYPRIVNYIPHVTVAYGDLTAEGYVEGRKYLESIDFHDSMKVSHVALVENFPDRDVEYKRFYFK